MRMFGHHEDPKVDIIMEYLQFWESEQMVVCVQNAENRWTLDPDPDDSLWAEVPEQAVQHTIERFGGRINLNDVDTLQDLLKLVIYYKSYTDVFSRVKSMRGIMGHWRFLRIVYDKGRDLKLKPALSEPITLNSPLEASQELEMYQKLILQNIKDQEAKKVLPDQDDSSDQAKSKSEEPKKNKPELLIVLGTIDDSPIVCGKKKKKLSVREYNILKTLIDAHPDRLSMKEIAEKPSHSEPSKALGNLSKKDPDWKRAISMPGIGGSGKGYGINPAE
ncbi:MAG: hypothetical protein HOE85_09455 [Nitrospinaceae bacterium]|nr:hypothetical protein [Nitrospinaceae bacterium]